MKKQFSKLLAGVVISAAVMSQAWAAEKVTVFAAASLTNAVDEIS
ncbi:molybdate ABC transporter substrate-binding protein, partial [Salmonella enterica subsp. enterica]|nr:molybdate ABC transporter substrate-binding protein [Salmonella enterica subsp. enterica serovar Typhimurium]